MPELLPLAAELSVALAGFSGLFVAFSSQRSGLRPIERYALLFLLFTSLGAVALSTLPYLLIELTGHSEFPAWFCLFPGLMLISISVWSSFTRLRNVADKSLRRYPWARRTMMPLQWLVGSMQFLPLISDVSAVLVYVTAVWWLLWVAGIQFILQLASATKVEGSDS